MDAQMYNPFETKLDSSASTPVVEEHLNDLFGLGPAIFNDLDHRGLQDNSNPLRVADLLRERNDGTIALEPRVRQRVSNRYVDELLNDALALLDDPSTTPGYFHASHNLRGRQYNGNCDIEGIKPSHYYPRPLLDALADLRGEYVITNIGQSGCFSCGCAAIDLFRESLEADNTPVQGRAGFSAQTNPESPTIRYEGFDDKLTTKELGERITTMLNSHDVPFNWDGDPERTIQTYPDA